MTTNVQQPPVFTKIKTGMILITGGSPYTTSGAIRSMFREDGNAGADPGAPQIIRDELGILTTDGSMATGVTYLSVPSNNRIVKLCIKAVMCWDNNATGFRDFYLAEYNTPTSPTPITPDLRNYSFANNVTYNTTLFVDTGFWHVKASGSTIGEFVQGKNYMCYVRQTSGGNLNTIIDRTYLSYTALVR